MNEGSKSKVRDVWNDVEDDDERWQKIEDHKR